MKTETAVRHKSIDEVKCVDGNYYVVIDENGNFYAETYSGSVALLITAAQELLEAAKSIKEHEMSPDSSGRICIRMEKEQWDKLQTIIAKAEWRS